MQLPPRRGYRSTKRRSIKRGYHRRPPKTPELVARTGRQTRRPGGAIVTSGKVAFDDLRVAHVFSPVTGRLTGILAQPGQRVKREQALATILSPDMGQVFSDLAKAQAAEIQTRNDWNRQKGLFASHAAAQRDYESAENAYLSAKAELERALRKAHLLSRLGGNRASQEFVIRSPIEGEIIMRAANPGIEVQGTYGGATPVELFTVGERDRVWVLGDLYEADLAQVRKGMSVTVTAVAYPQRLFEGTVEWVSGSLDPATRTAKLRVSVDNQARLLKPEMYATVSISTEQHPEVAIPRGALLRLGEQTIVFVQTGVTPKGFLKFERRPVAVVEEQGGDFLPVTHGLREGERIVTSGGLFLLSVI